MLMQTINYVPQILTLTGLAPSRSILRTLISSRMAFTSCWGRTRRIKSLNANILPDAKSLNYEYDLIYTIELKNMRKPSIYRLSVFFGGNESGGQPKLCAQSSNFRTSSSAFILHNKMTKIKFKIYLILYNKIFNKRKFCSTMLCITVHNRMWKPFAAVRIREMTVHVDTVTEPFKPTAYVQLMNNGMGKQLKWIIFGELRSVWN